MTTGGYLEEEDFKFIHVRFVASLYEELKAVAEEQERPVSGMVKFIVSQHLKQLR